MLLEFLGAAHEVTGSCHFLQCQDKRILVGLWYGAGTGFICESGDSGECIQY